MQARVITVEAPRDEVAAVDSVVRAAIPSDAWTITEPWTDDLGEQVIVDVRSSLSSQDADRLEADLREKIEALGYRTHSDAEMDALYEALPA